jgi:hypothetical protein
MKSIIDRLHLSRRVVVTAGSRSPHCLQKGSMGTASPPANHYRARTNLPRTCSRSARLAGRGDPRRMASMRSTRTLGTIPPATRSRGSRKPPARFLIQKPAAFAAFLKAHQGALIGAGMEGDAPADPALEHIVANLDLGHGHNGEGPDPVQCAPDAITREARDTRVRPWLKRPNGARQPGHRCSSPPRRV